MQKLSFSKSKSAKIMMGAFALGLAVSHLTNSRPSYAAGTDDAKTDDAASRAKIDEMVKFAEGFSGRMEVLKLTQRMGINQSDFGNFLKTEATAGRLNGAEAKAWEDLINQCEDTSNAESANVAAETTGAYIKLRQSGLADNLPFNEKDLAAMPKSWSIEQRTNFSRVVRRAAELSTAGTFATAEQAFEKAMDEMGYLNKYRQGCSK